MHAHRRVLHSAHGLLTRTKISRDSFSRAVLTSKNTKISRYTVLSGTIISLECVIHTYICALQGCAQVGKALSVPPTAILSCLLLLISFFASHSSVVVEGTNWVEPVIVWLTVVMPSGSSKSSVFKYVLDILGLTRKRRALPLNAPSWTLDEATFEKMGAIMDENSGRLLGICDRI